MRLSEGKGPENVTQVCATLPSSKYISAWKVLGPPRGCREEGSANKRHAKNQLAAASGFATNRTPTQHQHMYQVRAEPTSRKRAQPRRRGLAMEAPLEKPPERTSQRLLETLVG
eukprot:gnl/MRDRNA2_/MRDRNA2_155554_c0_seq1.p2 gnl/MRDRNA2_/MRDRNA2_155554_c0~~gnl/MRDRNA2_/MRDRNA2_155554_c0_seq1.p2  ORF type:complete len:114 (-),score=4.33 gnl/MRDRNA2_/MRDRNA2_155554_c0_seq1:267-608(-)